MNPEKRQKGTLEKVVYYVLLPLIGIIAIMLIGGLITYYSIFK